MRTRAEQESAFLNIPYDQRYESLYLAFMAGLCRIRTATSSDNRDSGRETTARPNHRADSRMPILVSRFVEGPARPQFTGDSTI